MVDTTLARDTIVDMRSYGSNTNTMSSLGRSMVYVPAPPALNGYPSPTPEQLAALSPLLASLEDLKTSLEDLKTTVSSARRELPPLLREMGTPRRWSSF